MTATFYRKGRGRSLNAREAETDGRTPLTRAIPIVAREAGVTRKVARAALEATYSGEWHHVGKFAAECRYYDTAEAIQYLALQPAIAKLPPDWQDQISEAMTAAGPCGDGKAETMDARCEARTAACERLAAIAGCTADEICDAYYKYD